VALATGHDSEDPVSGGREVVVSVAGVPPAKSEAQSMLGARHPHAERVIALLEAARDTLAGGAVPLGSAALSLELDMRCPPVERRSDATNYLGGVADVLQDKAPRGLLDHLGRLARVHLFDDDRQFVEVTYRWRPGDPATYTVALRVVDPLM
jgi:hypothetical protein